MKKLLIVVFVVVLGLPLALWLYLQTPVFGAHPASNDWTRFEQSVAFNTQTRQFEHRRPDLMAKMREQNSTMDMMPEWFKERTDGRPTVELPQTTPDFDALSQSAQIDSVIWFGHSSFVLHVAGLTVLVDPVFF